MRPSHLTWKLPPSYKQRQAIERLSNQLSDLGIESPITMYPKNRTQARDLIHKLRSTRNTMKGI
jgi:hypothetical protein